MPSIGPRAKIIFMNFQISSPLFFFFLGSFSFLSIWFSFCSDRLCTLLNFSFFVPTIPAFYPVAAVATDHPIMASYETTTLLDLSEVALKPKAPYTYTPKRNRPFGLIEPPTFYPTKEQFKDTYSYIESIAEEGSKYGIIKIVPPSSWNPKFAIDTGVSRSTEIRCLVQLALTNFWPCSTLHLKLGSRLSTPWVL